MDEESWRVVLIVATIMGFLLTVGGLIAAFISAAKEVEASGIRYLKSLRLAAEEKLANQNRLKADPSSSGIDMNHEFIRRYSAEGLIRPSFGNFTYVPALEARRLLKLTLQGARVNLVVDGIGLTVSTAATVIGFIVL
jgi:hypothetical protein